MEFVRRRNVNLDSLNKACNREKRPWVSYVINQEDGQTERTDYTDANILRKGD